MNLVSATRERHAANRHIALRPCYKPADHWNSELRSAAGAKVSASRRNNLDRGDDKCLIFISLNLLSHFEICEGRARSSRSSQQARPSLAVISMFALYCYGEHQEGKK